MLKKILIMILVVTFMLSCTGCYVYRSDERPMNQAPSTWICDEAKIKIIILEGNKDNGSVLDPICTIELDDILDCEVLFSHGPGIEFKIDDHQFLDGKCIYEKDYFIVEVEKDTIFNGKYDKLTFEKTAH